MKMIGRTQKGVEGQENAFKNGEWVWKNVDICAIEIMSQ